LKVHSRKQHVAYLKCQYLQTYTHVTVIYIQYGYCLHSDEHVTGTYKTLPLAWYTISFRKQTPKQ